MLRTQQKFSIAAVSPQYFQNYDGKKKDQSIPVDLEQKKLSLDTLEKKFRLLLEKFDKMHQHQTTKQWKLLPRVTRNRFFWSESPGILEFVLHHLFLEIWWKIFKHTHTPSPGNNAVEDLSERTQAQIFPFQISSYAWIFLHPIPQQICATLYPVFLNNYEGLLLFQQKEKFSHPKSKFASKNKNRHILMCVNALILFLYLWLI